MLTARLDAHNAENVFGLVCYTENHICKCASMHRDEPTKDQCRLYHANTSSVVDLDALDVFVLAAEIASVVVVAELLDRSVAAAVVWPFVVETGAYCLRRYMEGSG